MAYDLSIIIIIIVSTSTYNSLKPKEMRLLDDLNLTFDF